MVNEAAFDDGMYDMICQPYRRDHGHLRDQAEHIDEQRKRDDQAKVAKPRPSLQERDKRDKWGFHVFIPTRA
jgi:hypothetical protein